MLPLQSAVPRPYQRPSFSVSSKGGVSQAVVVERRLHVVVGVQQHRGCVGARARSGADDGVAAVRGLRQPGVGEAEGGEVVEHPLRGPVALLGRELARVGDRPDGDQLGQLLASPGA